MSAATVLVLGLPGEPCVRSVLTALSALDLHIAHWNPRDLSNDIELVFEHGVVDGVAVVDGEVVELRSVSAVFDRLSDVEMTPEFRRLDPNGPLATNVTRAQSLVRSWCDIAPCRVVNRPSMNDNNSAKPFQAMLIRPFFDVPSSLSTNAMDDALAFVASHERVVYKSNSGERSIVTELDIHDLEAQAPALRRCPVLFQEYIEGTDVRVHVVGENVFATAVEANGMDYRYSGDAQWRGTEIPDDIALRCIELAAWLQLELSGIDLRLRPDGGVTCFEVNPCPAFEAYEAATGQPLAAAVADLLSS